MQLPLYLLILTFFAASPLVTSEYDFWREKGEEPKPNNCYSHNANPAPMEVGDTITITYKHLCDYGGPLLETSSEGVKNIGWLQAGHFVAFDANLPTAGLFSMEIRVASPDGEGAFTFRNQDTGEFYKIFNSVPNTGNWQSWSTISAGDLALPKGYSILQLQSLQRGWNLMWMKFTLKEAFEELVDPVPLEEDGGAPATPAKPDVAANAASPEEPAPLYDYIVLAEEFNIPEGVSVENANDFEKNLAFMFAGDLLKFNLKVREAGLYKLYAKVSNPTGVGSVMITGQRKHDLYAEVPEIEATADWGEWQVMEVGEISIGAGSNFLQVLVLEGGFNLMHLGADYVGPAAATGGDGVYFAVNAAAGLTSHQGVKADANLVGQLDPDDFMIYDVKIPKAGAYTISILVAGPNGDGAFSLLDGATDALLGKAASLPATANWWTGEAIDVPVTLKAGKLSLKILVEEGGFNLISIVFRMDA